MKAQDYRTWDWGGEMVIHQLVQLPDGDLGLTLPKGKRELFVTPIANCFIPVTDGWKEQDGGFAAVKTAEQDLCEAESTGSTAGGGHLTCEKRDEGRLLSVRRTEQKETGNAFLD